jgi:hypothetical protein
VEGNWVIVGAALRRDGLVELVSSQTMGVL